jgi:hypothetical protein
VVQATLRHAFQIAGPEMRDLRIGHDAFVAAPTHATVATFRMDLSRESEQRDGLSHMIVPRRQVVAWLRGRDVDAGP